MKILQINSVCGIRSTGRICTDLAKVLEKQGHECKIAYGREAVPPIYQNYAHLIGNSTSVKFDALKTRFFDNAGLNSKRVTKTFIEWIKEYDPDIIHLHNIHGYYINYEILFEFLKTYRKPTIWTLHDCWSFTGHCSHFTTINCNRWQSNCFDCPQKKDYPTSILFDCSSKNFKKKKAIFSSVSNLTIVTPSKWLTNLVKESFLQKFPIITINNGIDLNVFKYTKSDFRERYNLKNKKVILGVSSIWNNKKGYGDFLKLSYLLGDDYRIVLVGVSNKQMKELPSNIIGISRTNNARELAQIYSAADIFINPTYEDNYPTVNLEAQACKTPVITYNTGGSIESVPAENIVNKKCAEAIVDKIINSENLMLSNINFDKNHKYNEYLKLYNNIIGCN